MLSPLICELLLSSRRRSTWWFGFRRCILRRRLRELLNRIERENLSVASTTGLDCDQPASTNETPDGADREARPG